MKAKLARREAREARRADRAFERATRAVNRGGSSGSGTRAPVLDQGPLIARMNDMQQELYFCRTSCGI